MQHAMWNMFSAIQNASAASKKSLIYPQDSFCVQILRVLYKEGYISGFRVVSLNDKKIEIFLKYIDGKPALNKIRPVSKPGRRVFVPVDALWKLETSVLTFLVSTSKGVLSDKQCRRFHQGGEVLCFIS